MPRFQSLPTPAGDFPTDASGALRPANDCRFAALPAAMHTFMISFVKTATRLDVATTSRALLELWGSIRGTYNE